MKSIKGSVPHPGQKEGDTFWKDAGNFVVSDEAYDFLIERGEKIKFYPSLIPGCVVIGTFKDWGDDDSSGKKKKW